MDASDIRALIARDEGQATEFKKSFGETNEALDALAAFVSQDGGTVIFGISPAGKVVGVTIGPNTLENFDGAAVAKIKPQISPDIRIHGVEGKAVVTVTVPALKTVHFADGRFHVRVGRVTRVATPEELRRRVLAQPPIHTPRESPFPDYLEHDEVLWVDEGDDYVGGGLMAEGPLCPKDWATLRYQKHQDLRSESRQVHDDQLIVGGNYGTLRCPECGNEYDLGGLRKTVGESRAEVEDRFAGRRRRRGRS